MTEQQQKPVAWRWRRRNSAGDWCCSRLKPYGDGVDLFTIEPLYTAPQPAPGWDEATGYAERLAVALWEKHYKTDADQWKPLSGDLIGILTQIDNMTTGLSRSSQSTTDAITDDQITYANELAEDRRREWTANARLREALRPFTEYAPTSIMREDDSWVLRIPHNARQPMFADFDKARQALSTDPRASDCEQHGEPPKTEFITGYFADQYKAGAKPPSGPSDCPADVTCESLACFIKSKAQVDFGGWETDLARALLDVFTVGRR